MRMDVLVRVKGSSLLVLFSLTGDKIRQHEFLRVMRLCASTMDSVGLGTGLCLTNNLFGSIII